MVLPLPQGKVSIKRHQRGFSWQNAYFSKQHLTPVTTATGILRTHTTPHSKVVISRELDVVVHDTIRNLSEQDACTQLHAKPFSLMLL